MTAPEQQPLTPGSIWRSRGTAGHDHYEVRITKLTAAGRVTFVRAAHRRGVGERRNTAAEPSFRAQFEPVKVEPVSEAQQAYHQLDALRYQERARQRDAARNGALVDRLGLDPEDLIAPAAPPPASAAVAAVLEVPEPEPIRSEPEEPEPFGGSAATPQPLPVAPVPVLDRYLDAGLAALAALDEQLKAKDAQLAALAAEKDVLLAQRAAINASLETLSQQAPVAPKLPSPGRHR